MSSNISGRECLMHAGMYSVLLFTWLGIGACADEPFKVECPAVANTVYLSYPDQGIEIESHDVEVWLNSNGQPIGLHGTSTGGDMFTLRRDGDNSDGSFAPGTYDASEYPYHLLVEVWPAGSGDECERNPQCRFYVGLSGTWNITSSSPLQGSLDIGTLTREENCWQEGDPIDVSGCTILDGQATGCFNLAAPE